MITHLLSRFLTHLILVLYKEAGQEVSQYLFNTMEDYNHKIKIDSYKDIKGEKKLIA